MVVVGFGCVGGVWMVLGWWLEGFGTVLEISSAFVSIVLQGNQMTLRLCIASFGSNKNPPLSGNHWLVSAWKAGASIRSSAC